MSYYLGHKRISKKSQGSGKFLLNGQNNTTCIPDREPLSRTTEDSLKSPVHLLSEKHFFSGKTGLIYFHIIKAPSDIKNKIKMFVHNLCSSPQIENLLTLMSFMSFPFNQHALKLQKGYKIKTPNRPYNIFRNKADVRFDSATFLQFILWIFMYRQDKNMTQQMLNSHILGSSLANLSIKNLREGVEFTLRNKQPVAVCVCSHINCTSYVTAS